jgi:hypothetical protein
MQSGLIEQLDHNRKVDFLDKAPLAPAPSHIPLTASQFPKFE